ncbi:hypothetical protein N3K66_003189 [Trichothecium roseum]|uniref:Uncharacterized protein n=1 Tax=Trichothecium roseum TaxID=47278 RepID=A0ACC0V7B3_9HYPO|nr:hypothetical protein N3K66_003189 [Trichothecium roseum]
MFQLASDPKTPLGRYRVLSSTAGVRVSPLCLGAMSLGDGAWADNMGSIDRAGSMALLDAFREAGGNFIDTASNYQDEESERVIGEWMEERGCRDEMVVATKYSCDWRSHVVGKGGRAVNFAGNSRKNLHLCARASLEKLRTGYIDILYVHLWDWTTSVAEVMDSLHALVEQGKVLYLGVSDTPAWIVAAANAYAATNGKTPFSVYQGRWNVMRRDFEREVIPMARHYGMALAPWDVLAGGKFQTREQVEERAKGGEALRQTLSKADGDIRFTHDQSDAEVAVSERLHEVARELGADVTVQQVALAYVMHKAIDVFPIVGGRKVEHLRSNIRALELRLSEEQIARLEAVGGFSLGFPMDLIGDDPRVTGKNGFILETVAKVDWPTPQKPVGMR